VPMSQSEDFVARLPKAELHLHIEGTLEPEMMFALAVRNGVEIPYGSVEELRAAYCFESLQDFLDLYYQGMNVLREAEDFYDLSLAYFRQARAENIRHAEVFFDPQAHMRRGVSFATVIEGISRARRDAEAEFGVTSKLILCFLRDLSADDAMATLGEALAYRDRIIGVGLDSAEVGHPPDKFEAVFTRARAEGLLAVAHAGEEGPAAYVREAVDVLKVVRIDHGNRCLDDPALVARLAAEAIPLTVCPLSNLKLGVIKEMAHHPLREMLDRGLLVTVNSDDPAYFGGYVNENYRAVRDALALSDATLAELARNSFRASFLSEPEKARHLAEVDAVAVQNH
jgi:adenine deaminase